MTGAAGFVGHRVVQHLAGGEERVVAIDAVPVGEAEGVQPWLIDLARDPGNRVRSALAGADTVIHLAWSHSDPPAADAAVPFPNLKALRAVLDAAAEAGVRRLVHVSSATVYGAWPDNPVPLREDAPLRPNPGFRYAVEKGEAERAVAEWADDHPDTAVAILRPTVTVGSTGPALYQGLAGLDTPQPATAARPMQFLDVSDFVGAIVFARDHGLQGVFNVAPDGWIDLDRARAIVGGLTRLRLPEGLAAMVATLGWRFLRTGTPAEARPYSMFPWVVANDRLRAEGWAPSRSNEEALAGSDDRRQWSDLPSNPRDEALLLAAGLGFVAASGAAAAGMAALAYRMWRRWRRGVRGVS